MDTYTPSEEILSRYADVMVNFALWGGKGINKGDVVHVTLPDAAKPFLDPLHTAILKAGGHMILNYTPSDRSGYTRAFFEHADDEQLAFHPKDYLLEQVNTVDHYLVVLATADKYHLQGIDSKKIMEPRKALKFFFDARDKKESAGKQSWTICLYGTDAMAEDAGLSPEAYWNEIIQACYLDEAQPAEKWKEIDVELQATIAWLKDLDIDTVHLEGEDVDLTVKIGENRNWLAGLGCNIPSFEVFTSPDFRGTNGWIRFNQPLYRYGDRIAGIRLEFKDGDVVSATADENEQLLKDMIAIPGMEKVGEFSLTDKRLSRISKFMGETLYDENMGSEFGNTHIALGKSFLDAYDGDPKTLQPGDWKNLDFNDSAEHVDIISTSNRTVTATLKDGSKVVIYKDGEFQR